MTVAEAAAASGTQAAPARSITDAATSRDAGGAARPSHAGGAASTDADPSAGGMTDGTPGAGPPETAAILLAAAQSPLAVAPTAIGTAGSGFAQDNLDAGPADQGAADPTAAALSPAAAAAVARYGEAVVPIGAVGIEIATRVGNGQKSFQIRLDPPDLGLIDVKLSVDSSGHVTSHLMADRPETLALLKQDAPALQRALEAAGLRTDAGGLEFSLRNQSFAGGGQPQNSSAAFVGRSASADTELPPLEAASRGYGRIMGQGTGVDIRV